MTGCSVLPATASSSACSVGRCTSAQPAGARMHEQSRLLSLGPFVLTFPVAAETHPCIFSEVFFLSWNDGPEWPFKLTFALT